MIIDWLGHSCFKVTLKNGTRILFDPYDDETGYQPTDVEADIVAISHAHHDHSDLSHVKGSYTALRNPGTYSFGDLQVEGINTYHDCEKGALRGENIVFVLSINGLRLCHMGDIGCVPGSDVMEKLKGTEILLLPVGGHYTIDAQQALEICEMISPNIIIPMHFKTPATDLDIAPLHEFLEAAGREYDISHLGKCYLKIDKASLKKRTRIMVMEYL